MSEKQHFMCNEEDEELNAVPVVDLQAVVKLPNPASTPPLQGFFASDPDVTFAAAREVMDAFKKYEVFQVVNQGLEGRVLEQALGCQERFFEMSLEEKARGEKKKGELLGNTNNFAYSREWKETLSLLWLLLLHGVSGQIQDHFVSAMGEGLIFPASGEALCNGRIKSCLHRSVVNSNKARKSMVFFLSPEGDKVVSPLREMADEEHPRKYLDFEWSKLLYFAQKIYKPDTKTVEAFFQWLRGDQTMDCPSERLVEE